MSDYYLVVTDLGLELIEQAYKDETQVNITQMALGDSDGQYVEPDSAFTELVNEFGRQDIQASASTTDLIEVIAYVDAQFGGETVREFGLLDDSGNLIVYGAYPASLVPAQTSGEYIQLEIEARVSLANADSVKVVVNPYIPYATETMPGAVIISNSYTGESDTKAVTEKALKEGLATRYGDDNPPPEATETAAGIVVISNLYDGESETKTVTEKALKDGLETRYGEDNPSPLLLKFKTVSYLNISLLPVNSTPVEWVVPSGGENMKFAEVELMVITSELINCFLTIYFHEDDSGSDTSSAYSKCCFSIPPFNGSHNVRLSFTIPTSLHDGQSPKRLTFDTSVYTPSGTDPNAVISNFQLLIDKIRVVDHEQ